MSQGGGGDMEVDVRISVHPSTTAGDMALEDYSTSGDGGRIAHQSAAKRRARKAGTKIEDPDSMDMRTPVRESPAGSRRMDHTEKLVNDVHGGEQRVQSCSMNDDDGSDAGTAELPTETDSAHSRRAPETAATGPMSKHDAGSTEAVAPAKASAFAPTASGEFRPRMGAPAVKLSVKLIDTYNHINKVYYDKKAKNKYCDDKWDYIVKHGEKIRGGKYELLKVIGSGSFGQVVKAIDHGAVAEDGRPVHVAIKIIKNKRAFFKQAETEIRLLHHLNHEISTDVDPNIVVLQEHFVHRGHQCLVFELLSYNLYDLLRLTKFRGVSLNLIRKFGRQILTSLKVLKDSRIIHCDLKPENILLRHPKRSGIKLIDFGSSCQDKKVYTYIQSRYYRAPEVILGTGYDEAIDMWSLGCTLVEMHTGEPLFGGQNEGDQLKKIVEVLGPLPQAMVDKREAKKKEITKDLHKVMPKQTLNDVIADAKRRNRDKEDHGDHDYEMFLDLVRKLLTYDPSKRITPRDALAHTFLSQHGVRSMQRDFR